MGTRGRPGRYSRGLAHGAGGSAELEAGGGEGSEGRGRSEEGEKHEGADTGHCLDVSTLSALTLVHITSFLVWKPTTGTETT